VSPIPRTPGDSNVDGKVAEIGHAQIAQNSTAVSVWVRAHAAVAGGRKLSNSASSALVIEEFFGPIAPQPISNCFKNGRIRNGSKWEPDARGRCLHSAGPRSSLAPSSPWGVKHDHPASADARCFLDTSVMLDLF